MIGTAGNKGDSIRSDCFISVELTGKGGIEIDLRSKVASLYGRSIRERCSDILSYFGVGNARVIIEDEGALDFVISARMEAALKKLKPSEKQYLLPVPSATAERTHRHKPRRSRLYIPGNSPKLMINAGIHGADGVILLEDSVAPEKKDEARYLVRNALRALNFYGAEKMVRINQVPEGMKDLEFIVPHNVNLILIPKCETTEQILQVEEEIKRIAGTPDHGIHMMPIIESALGVINAYVLASASTNIVALAIGLEDYTADLGTRRSEEGKESFFARSAIVNAAAAAGIQAIDSVYSDVADMEGLQRNVTDSRALGFVGMGCIHPRQIKIINEGFNPDETEIERAKEIVLAFEEAERNGSGVIVIGSKMIDLPVVKRALSIIKTAVGNGLLKPEWREENHD